MNRFIAALIAVVAALACLVAGTTAMAALKGRYGDPSAKSIHTTAKMHTCLWEGPVGAKGVFSDDPTKINISNQLPDQAAVYWISRFSVEPGATLEFKGKFPHARYMSFNAYDGAGTPFTALADYEIKPDAGSGNPFKPGAFRKMKKRSYTVKALAESQPTGGTLPRNTMYLGAPGADGRVTGTVMYRVYVADRGYTIPGGAGIPKARLIDPDGTSHTGQDLCDVTDTPVRGKLRAASITQPLWDALVDADADPEAAPVRKTESPKFEMFFNATHAILGSFKTAEEQAAMDATQKGGLYSTIHNRYLYSMVSKEFGNVFTFHAKAPTFPKTYEGQKRMAKNPQVRFYSICTAQSPVTGQTNACAYDTQIPVDRKGRFNVVVSSPADRPANAIAKCGVTWLPWGPGDGFPGGRKGFALLIMRHMLPSPSFKKSVFAIDHFGGETVMGEYLPKGEYTSGKAFEKRGCPSPKYVPGK